MGALDDADLAGRTGGRRTCRPRRTPSFAVLLLFLTLFCLFAAVAPAGAVTAPGRPTAKTPSGAINATRPTFKWSKAARAAKYEVRVYQGSTLKVKKTGITRLSWTCSKTLPRGVSLTWKVRGRNARCNGAWSRSRSFKVRTAAKAITAFSFQGLSPPVTGIVTEAAHTIALTVPFGTNVTNLVATFTTTGASVRVGATLQVSGTTANNFSSPVTYRVMAANGTTQDYTVTVTVAAPPPSSAKAITAFSFASPAATGIVTEAAHTIALTVPFGTDVSALVATFTTTGASVRVGATLQVSGTTANNFSSAVTYRVTAADSTTQDYTVTVTVAADLAAKVITAFTIPGQTGATDLNQSAHTIAVTMPYGTVVTALTPTITISGASVSPLSGAARNFTSPVTYTVTAPDATTQAYTVTVTVAANPAKAITAFTIPGQTGTTVINETLHTVALTMPYGTDVSALVATFTTTGASVKVGSALQVSGTTANNFSAPVIYTVTAANAFIQDYMVSVTVAANPAKAITAFTIPSQTGTTVINEALHTIAVTMPYGTVVTALTPTITFTGASVSPSSGVAHNFSSPVVYTVTAADASTQPYTVTVTVAASPAKAITAFSFASPAATGVIDETSHTIAVTVPLGTVVTALAPTITFAGASVSPAGGEATDFSSPVVYTVTAADASTQDYTVTVTVAGFNSKAITAFSVPGQRGTAVINETDKTIAVTMPYGSVVTSLTPTIAITGASVSPSSGVAQNFSSPVFYTVTAADSSTESYTVTVTVAAISAKAIIAFTIPGQRGATAINETDKTIAVTMPYGTVVTALVPTISTTGASVSPASGVANNFSSPRTYTVTATDASTQAYTATVTAAPLTIGDAYQGGKVAYILQSGDPGYVGGQTRGLIAAAADQSTGIQWYNGTGVVTGATETALGTGLANTNTIIEVQGATATSYAAGLARAYNGGGHSDWYLPSQDELNKLYLSRAAIGGFASAYYWSSSEDDTFLGSTFARDQHFGSGYPSSGSKEQTNRVRAVRAFPASPAKAITAFGFSFLSVTGSINEALHTIDLTVPFGTNVGALTPTITITGASVSPASGVARNFSSPRTYTVTAADDTAQAYMVTVTVAAAVVGQSYGGGRIAYILQSGDPGYVDDGQTRGLIAAVADQGTGIRWYNGTGVVTGATGTTLGTGLANTNAIIAAQGATATSYAAGLARANAGGGHTDWYLPSKDELNKLYLNRAAIGGFSVSAAYWSSSEWSSGSAWYQSFGDGSQASNVKSGVFMVRAVRTFPAGPAKAITAFNFSSPAATGVINDADHTIAVTVPFGTNVHALVPTITYTGGSVFPGSEVPNDFTSPRSYFVTAADSSSTQGYTVTVTVAWAHIGQSYGGGKIAYIDPTGERGLIAATSDLTGTRPWSDITSTLVGTTQTGMGTGRANTTAIAGQTGCTTGAARDCDLLVEGGYGDWYLPSKDELNKLYLSKGAVGGFDSSAFYWSSSENDANTAWYQNFVSGAQANSGGKDYLGAVRAVRTFPASPAKAITGFSFSSPAVGSWINESTHAIALTVPFGTNVTNLVATFTTTGASVRVGATLQVSGTTANDFSSPVTYTVTDSGDFSTQDYVVTVMVADAEVGQSYGGGKIAYVDGTGKHGLIAAIADQSTPAGMAWSNITALAVAGTQTAMGTGQTNTTGIVGQDFCTSGAAYVCDHLIEGGYSDWYLPSKDELYQLFLHADTIGGFSFAYGEGAYYWSSSEAWVNGAWYQDMNLPYFYGDPTQHVGYKVKLFRVRAVRSF